MGMVNGQWVYEDTLSFETNFYDWYAENKREYSSMNMPYPYTEEKARGIFCSLWGYKNNITNNNL